MIFIILIYIIIILYQQSTLYHYVGVLIIQHSTIITKMDRVLRVLVFGLLTLALGISSAEAGKRVALVIGNDSYKTLPDLDNARTDARGMAAKLKELGWSVILKQDASGGLEVKNARGYFPVVGLGAYDAPPPPAPHPAGRGAAIR